MSISARKITNRGTKKNTGYFPSIKNERPVAYESLLERDFIYLLEFDPDVISYIEQPITIDYFYSKRKCRYTPDFLIKRRSKIQLVEVKPQSKLDKLLNEDRMIKKFGAAAHYCKFNGYSEFKIITDSQIRSGHFLHNVKYLFAYSRLHVPASCRLEIRNELIKIGHQQISQLLTHLCSTHVEHSKYYSYILAMLYHHELKTDLNLPFNKKSIINP